MQKTPQDLLNEAKTTVDFISCDAYRDFVVSGGAHVLLDVREDDEFEAGHIDGALPIPRGLLEFKVREQIPDFDTFIVVCCATGGRATLACQTLEEMGYTHVVCLEGGYGEYCKEE